MLLIVNMEKKQLFELREHIRDILRNYPDALNFLFAYIDYIHAIDDIIDEPDKRNDDAFILRTFAMSAQIFAFPFYRQFGDKLALIDNIINNEFADTLIWGQSSEEWKRRHADVMRHCGYNMFYAVVWICCGYDKMREISAKFREWSHYKHLNDNFQYETEKEPFSQSNPPIAFSPVRPTNGH